MTHQMEIESNRNENVEMQSAWQMIQSCFNVLNHIMISIVAVYMTILCYNAGNTLISWHAWLCTIGYQLLMTQAIMAFYLENVWLKKQKRQIQKTIHWMLQAVGSTTAFAGIILEYINRCLKSKAHFSSTHSIIGLIAAILTFVSIFNGIFALYSSKLKKFVRPVHSKLAHNLNGIIAFVLGMIALYFGYDKGYMVKNSCANIRMWLQVLTIITIALTLIGAVRATLNHFRTAAK